MDCSTRELGAFPILTQTESKERVTDIGLMPTKGQRIKYQLVIVLSLLHLGYFWLPERVIYRFTYGGSTLGNNSCVYQLFGWFLTMPAFESQDSNNRTLTILLIARFSAQKTQQCWSSDLEASLANRHIMGWILSALCIARLKLLEFLLLPHCQM